MLMRACAGTAALSVRRSREAESLPLPVHCLHGLDGSLAQHGLVPRPMTAEEVPDEVFPDLSFRSCAEGVLGTLLRPFGHRLGLSARSCPDP